MYPDDLDDPPKRDSGFRLHAVGGLANRLRAILSYRAHYGPLTVVWEPDEYVSYGRWADVFEPIDGVTFEDRGAWHIEAYAPHPSAKDGWLKAYGELVPKIGNLDPSPLAIHIRRTDHVPMLKELGRLPQRLDEWRDWTSARSGSVWIACDNGETQRAMMQYLGDRARLYELLPGKEEQGLVDHHRNGSLKHAVVDLYMCAAADEFRGTRDSSFSDTIDVLRSLRHARPSL